MHKMANFPDMYSLHSWIGIVVVVLFAIQVGFVIYKPFI
ncbi:uncharacterized protein DEA37_0015030 [Paragonimus westermani]|uniref:Cytochrome b561 domain-containing protein n=1 Tax=Paragonimus westermani TaxID=34504 RepID=A0A5J4NNB8_9TREM|nr:uncharacterized protein DEA37_0015029 [Paragonimus westermani]KAA3677061.1 uncharacterized protein DEA37_0015030 [Paragonimus westermani]